MGNSCSICGAIDSHLKVCDKCGLLYCNSGCGEKNYCKECIFEFNDSYADDFDF